MLGKLHTKVLYRSGNLVHNTVEVHTYSTIGQIYSEYSLIRHNSFSKNMVD